MNETAPRVRLLRRTSDFHRRPTHLLQAGTTTTCCTCCFVWVGTALGGSLGLVHGWRAFRGQTAVAAIHRRRILIAYAAGSVVMTAIFFSVYFGLATLNDNLGVEALIGGLALFSPLIFLVLGLFALLTTFWSTRRSDPEERTAAFNGVCRLVWMSFNYANLGWIVSLGIFIGIGEQKFNPFICLAASLILAAAVLLGGAWWNRRAAAKSPLI